MGLDGLGSASYGPEATLTVLAAVGTAGLAAVQSITWAILLLLAVLFLSYWQTVAAYLSNGGSYTVARENLGHNAGLLAAAALMVDYMLNVAVGISAGVGALTTGTALAVILAAKFAEGAWLTIIIPLTLVLLKLTRRYYWDQERQVLAGSRRAMDLRDHAAPVVVIPLERWDRMAHRAVQIAARLSPDVVALHLTDLVGPDAREHETHLRRERARFVERPAAAAGLLPPVLLVEPSPYRSVLAPLLREVEAMQRRCPSRPVIVVLSELAGGRWWEAVMHTRRAQCLAVGSAGNRRGDRRGGATGGIGGGLAIPGHELPMKVLVGPSG